MILSANPDFESIDVPKGKIRKSVNKLATSTAFDIFIMGCIILNMIQMGM